MLKERLDVECTNYYIDDCCNNDKGHNSKFGT